MKFDQLFQYIIESTIKPENLTYEYDQKPNSPVRIRKPYDWTKFEVGKYYSDGDVLNYIKSLHDDFQDDIRLDGCINWYL